MPENGDNALTALILSHIRRFCVDTLPLLASKSNILKPGFIIDPVKLPGHRFKQLNRRVKPVLCRKQKSTRI